MLTTASAALLAPLPSVTVSVTRRSPAVPYVKEGDWLVESGVPSPSRSHEYASAVQSGSTPCPWKSIVLPTA